MSADIGINLKETATDKTNIQYNWSIEEIGNLAYMHALHTVDASQFDYTQTINLGEEISDLIFKKGGETTFDLRTFTAKIK